MRPPKDLFDPLEFFKTPFVLGSWENFVLIFHERLTISVGYFLLTFHLYWKLVVELGVWFSTTDVYMIYYLIGEEMRDESEEIF